MSLAEELLADLEDDDEELVDAAAGDPGYPEVSLDQDGDAKPKVKKEEPMEVDMELSTSN